MEIDNLHRAMFDYRNDRGTEDVCALVAEHAWMRMMNELRDKGDPFKSHKGGLDPTLRIGGFEAWHFPVMVDGWLIGPKEEMMKLRKLVMTAKHKEIAHFLENFEP